MKNGSSGGFTTLHRLTAQTSRNVRALKRAYSALCSDGADTEPESFFADNFHTVLSVGTRPEKSRPSRPIYLPDGKTLADALIDASEDRFPDADSVIMILRGAFAGRRVYGSEVEYLRLGLISSLTARIRRCLRESDRELIRFVCLLGDISALDFVRINDVLNPVAQKLSADPVYRKSDPKTRLMYREAIYKRASETGADELRLCETLSGDGLMSLALGKKSGPRSALIAASCLIAASAALSLSIAFLAGFPLAALFLFLPATEALRPLSDMILRSRRPPSRLMRLDPRCEEVSRAKTAIVLSAAVFDPEDAVGLYSKMLGLRCSNPADNIRICALIDLSPEQVPMTSEDRAVIDSVAETVEKLNSYAGRRFSALIRKRTFSETQQEYMGAYRKRGALLEAARYMRTGKGDFCSMTGCFSDLVGVEYICAVDSDTRPLMDSVPELLSIALHPANRAEISDGAVVRGYGIVAPRMLTRLGDSLSSEFSKSLGGIGSRSSYDEESADLYQDVFGRGTFCGKGLINAEALIRCTDNLSGERILSHDILEGELLRTAYAGDICFTEGFPKSPQSYYRRLDRWIRGDFQNLPEIFSRRFDVLSKLKLSDNLRRAAIPPAVFSAFFLGFFGIPAGALVCGLALLLWLFPSVWGTASALLRGRFFGRRFYSGLISSASQSARYILYSAVMLPTLAVKSLAAAVTALFRLMTGRKLLEWTTSDSSDKSSQNPIAFYILPELLSLSLLRSPDYLIRLFGALFSLMPALLAVNRSAPVPSGSPLRYRDTRELSRQTADMWGFFENYVTRSENFLPPDNVQFSPVYRIAHRTSPTNIGLYLISALAAFDRRLISFDALCERLKNTLGTLSRLEKYRGNLYNWYDTETLALCPRPYVSSVDSGNFVCCLVALKEGLSEQRSPAAEPIIRRIEKLIDETDLSVFYDPVRGLMSIGIDPSTGKQDRSHYDCLMSEARLTSFWAIATRQVPKSHWQRLSRSMLRSGFFGGAASYSGTMFEYYMPEIFLKSPEGSLSYESLRYALWVQRRYAKSLDRPFGISESGCYSFDSALNYRYSAHGVPNTGLRRGLEQSYVVSPYSTYISLCFSGSDGVENLRKLILYGMYGSFGFYEALDFTSSGSDKPEPVRSYMAHHVGMSIAAADNVLFGGIMQKRFMRDLRVRGALELLDERFHLGTAVFENDLRRPKPSSPEPRESETEVMTSFDLRSPRMKLLCNGELTLAVADSGCSQLLYRSKNVFLRTRDPLRPKGIFFFISDGGPALPFSMLPGTVAGSVAEFSDDSATFYRNTSRLAAGMKIRLCADMPCELRSFALKNTDSKKLPASIVCYADPSLSDDADEAAHPAYSKLFLRPEHDPEWNAVTVTRVREDKKIYLGIGFVEDIPLTVSFDRGEVLDRPDGIEGLITRFKDIPPSGVSVPDPCVFIRAEVELPPRSDTEITMFTVCADSREELINRISSIRRKRPKFSASPRLDTAPGRVAAALLPKILFGLSDSDIRREAVSKNTLPLRALWELSVSTDVPTVLVELNGRGDAQKLSAYLGAYKLLRLCGIKIQAVFSFDDGGRYEREHYTELISAARAEGLEASVYSTGGILPLDLSKSRSGLQNLCRAFACHICADGIIPPPVPAADTVYQKILPSRPTPKAVVYPVACGGFSGDSYVINEKPTLPWCHILSNPVFGTLLSEGSLGFSYAFNSRENRLTPWDNDPERDNLGERLILDIGGKSFDLVRGSAAVFSPYKAEYFSEGDGFRASVTVSVPSRGMCKKIAVRLHLADRATLSYYTEPCMGPERSSSRLIVPKRCPGGIILSSPASEVSGHMGVLCGSPSAAVTDRTAFLCGSREESVSPSSDLCAALCRDVSGDAETVFYLTYGLSARAAEEMPRHFSAQTDTRERKITVETGDAGLDRLMNVWLRYQALHARIWARTGFWQCSGAYGFRDQLQDAAGIAQENPGVLKTQILRCCAAQFKEGDVLHWWHSLPGVKTRGIRTRISDDALWLPYALCEYLRVTGDEKILGINAAYCDGITLGEGEKERYGEVYRTALRESVYQHCRRAIDRSRGKTGPHGLMLIGTGDWNDGFGNVGAEGSGESVWLSEFYIILLRRFSKIAEQIGDMIYSRSLLEYADGLSAAVEENGRDFGHYLRGYFDCGAPLGSSKSSECKIDSLSQSFAEFASLGSGGFARQALLKAYSELCDISGGVIKLFTPAFSDDADPNPGYVRSYPEGVRENGGQYTHGAVWLGMALLKAGLADEGKSVLLALDPVRKSRDGGHRRYKTEPYYLCGDVYSNPSCPGRGGWSIYTGSAAWYYRALRESLCGVAVKGGKLVRLPAPEDAEVSEERLS